jgi:hypothetical protein
VPRLAAFRPKRQLEYLADATEIVADPVVPRVCPRIHRLVGRVELSPRRSRERTIPLCRDCHHKATFPASEDVPPPILVAKVDAGREPE